MSDKLCLAAGGGRIYSNNIAILQSRCQAGDDTEKRHTQRTLGTVAMYVNDGAKVTRDGVGHLGVPNKREGLYTRAR